MSPSMAGTIHEAIHPQHCCQTHARASPRSEQHDLLFGDRSGRCRDLAPDTPFAHYFRKPSAEAPCTCPEPQVGWSTPSCSARTTRPEEVLDNSNLFIEDERFPAPHIRAVLVSTRSSSTDEAGSDVTETEWHIDAGRPLNTLRAHRGKSSRLKAPGHAKGRPPASVRRRGLRHGTAIVPIAPGSPVEGGSAGEPRTASEGAAVPASSRSASRGLFETASGTPSSSTASTSPSGDREFVGPSSGRADRESRRSCPLPNYLEEADAGAVFLRGAGSALSEPAARRPEAAPPPASCPAALPHDDWLFRSST